MNLWDFCRVKIKTQKHVDLVSLGPLKLCYRTATNIPLFCEPPCNSIYCANKFSNFKHFVCLLRLWALTESYRQVELSSDQNWIRQRIQQRQNGCKVELNKLVIIATNLYWKRGFTFNFTRYIITCSNYVW